MRVLTDNVWSIEPGAMRKLAAAMARYGPAAGAAVTVEAGPAGDGQRDGLPLQVDRSGVAMVHLAGPMVKNPGVFGMIFGLAGTLAVRRAIEAAAADEAVGSILLRIDSPGGSVDGLAELGDAVYAAAQQKPVVAQVDGMAASAAYYVASQATAIYAHRMDLIGSIGTRLMLYDWHRLFEKEGVEAVPIDTGEFKSAGALGTEITQSQRADFQRIVDAYFEDFRAAIIRGRGLSVDAVNAVADGRIWTATEAMAGGLGLIDGIQPLERTLADLQSRNIDQRRSRRASAVARVAEREAAAATKSSD